MLAYQRIALTAKPTLTDREDTLRSLVHILRTIGADICVDRTTLGDVSMLRAFPAYHFTEPVDALVVIGGDGTILRAVRHLQDLSVPILGINRGLIGFLSEVDMNELDDVLPSLLTEGGVTEERSLLNVDAMRNGQSLISTRVLNEAVISQGAIARLLTVRVRTGEEMIATFRADGLIFSSPTGSTAYALAAGGPILHPKLHAILLTPINAHIHSQKPIVLPADSILEAEIVAASSHASQAVGLTLDGQEYVSLQQGDIIVVRSHPMTARFIRRSSAAFFRTLRIKLRWE